MRARSLYWWKRPQGHNYGNTYVVCSPGGMADGYDPPSASVQPPRKGLDFLVDDPAIPNLRSDGDPIDYDG